MLRSEINAQLGTGAPDDTHRQLYVSFLLESLFFQAMEQMKSKLEQGSKIAVVTRPPARGDGHSIDIETMKLKRMIEKRNQMFEALSQIMKNYDDSSRSIIQNMR
jgi:hypothetical protein